MNNLHKLSFIVIISGLLYGYGKLFFIFPQLALAFINTYFLSVGAFVSTLFIDFSNFTIKKSIEEA